MTHPTLVKPKRLLLGERRNGGRHGAPLRKNAHGRNKMRHTCLRMALYTSAILTGIFLVSWLRLQLIISRRLAQLRVLRDDPEQRRSKGRGDIAGDRTVARDLCLGMAADASDPQLVVFAASFRKVAPLAHLVLFDGIQRYKRRREMIHRWYKVIALTAENGTLEPEFLHEYSSSSVRWVLFQRYLSARISDYDRVLIVDVRDTFFQENPFRVIGNPGLYTFRLGRQIGQSKKNVGWIKDCLGPSILSRFADLPIYYSGVTFGTANSAMHYARLMSDSLLSPELQKCERRGVDQALHNVLMNMNQIEDILRFDQRSAPAVDIKSGKYRVIAEQVINLDGREVPVVRGYSHDEELSTSVLWRHLQTEGYDALPGPSNEGEDDEADQLVDEESSQKISQVDACANFTVKEGIDLFWAVCDLETVSVKTLSSCCAACGKLAPCRAFTFDERAGLCYAKTCKKPVTTWNDEEGLTSGYEDS